MVTETRDCVVIGGGPAGSTFASIVKKYSPARSVTLLEAARFPRYHIGESTIPVANGVLRDLEVYDQVLASSAVKKMGIVFVWGADRVPWTADFIHLKHQPVPGGAGETVDVTGQTVLKLLGRPELHDTPFLGFNVRRADFDQMLLDRSRAFGVDVREETRVTAVLRGDDGAVRGVRWEDAAGREGTLEAGLTLDASGLSSVLTRGQREFDPHMNNFAVYGYLKGAAWKVTFNGTRDRSTVFIATIDHGWIWYFPIDADVMSVGVVTNKDHFKDRLAGVDLEAFWWESVRSCPEVAELVQGATLRTDVLPKGARVAGSQDWSSWARSAVGDGWAAAGDAAVFVDPVLSSGVTLALQSGHRAAYTYNTIVARPELPAASLWRAYADYARGEAGAFLTLARYFYGNNKVAKSWWWDSQRVVNRSGRLELDDRHAFTMATAGFFPTPRAISPAVVGSLLTHLSGTRADLYNVFRDTGVPPPDRIARSTIEILAPFRLDMRTEPLVDLMIPGRLDVFHDLVTDEPELAHRAAALACRLPPTLGPLVAAIPQHRSAASLIEAAPALLAAAEMTAEDARRYAIDVLRIAAMKGFIRFAADEEAPAAAAPSG